MVTTRDAMHAVSTDEGTAGLRVGRHFTTEGVHPYDQLEWELRDAVITDWRTGETAFEQRDVEFPSTWSMNATTIVAQKYFRGQLGTPQRERSVRQMIDRVADTITDWGRKDGYFADDSSARTFNDELKHLLVNQAAAFNSPVWFNVGVEDHPQCSACFILSVEDTMSSILNWYVEEGTIFKGGSGSGVNLSKIRSSKESLKGGGTASGPVSFMRGADASAGTIKCLHRDTPIVTGNGLKAVAAVQPGDQVLTRFGFRRVGAVHDNGVKALMRVRTELGDEVLCTPEHRFRVRGRDGDVWREAKDLQSDDHVLIDLSATQHGSLQALETVQPGHHNEIAHSLPAVLDEAFALWLGWVYGDGSVTERKSAKFIALQVGDADPELLGRYTALTRTIFGDQAHIFANRHADRPDASASIRFCSSQVIRFLERNGLRKGKAAEIRVPEKVWSSPASVRAAFLSGLFEADGHVGNGYPTLSTVSRGLAQDVHRLLLSVGIPSRISQITDRSNAHGSSPVLTVRVLGGEGVNRFAKLVGFLSERKSQALDVTVAHKSVSPYETSWVLPHVENELGDAWLRGDRHIKRALAPYARYGQLRGLSLPRARWLLERYPEALADTSLRRFAEGSDFYARVTVESAGDGPTFDLTVEDVHEYLVHNIVTHNSGGKTRRAAKMVILDVDHPDVEEFIWCKCREEQKARALREAGFDMDLDGKDSASVQYQNANNSVRATDAFMHAVEAGADFALKTVTTDETTKTIGARELFRQIAQAAWECADPGMQYDTTINDWHTTPNAGRINGSNPCCFVGETLVETVEGPVPFELLEKRARAGESLPKVRTFDLTTGSHTIGEITDVWVAGHTDALVQVQTAHGLSLYCTPDHRFLCRDGSYVEARELTIGTALRAVSDDGRDVGDWVLSVTPVEGDPVAVYDLEVSDTHNFAVLGDRAIEDGIGVLVHNSEYMHLDNSACNLASLNLRRFEADGVFDVDAFRHAVEIVFTAQEIIVGNSSYPTERIGENARAYRQLGLGYANLGSLLMSQGLAYDSDEGRAWASAITALMTGHAYRTSAEVAKAVGPFAGFAADRDGMLRILRKHRDALTGIDTVLAPGNILAAARASWNDAVELGNQHGVRNAQSTVIAPTGTIAFLMDCDTTGIEPDLGLVKSKKLVGGGSMRIVNQTVPVGLRRLGYQAEQIEAIVAYIDEHATIEGAPAFRPEHLSVFDCAMGERSIAPMGHLRMMAAAQPWISGAISKTVNLPESATVEDVESIFMEGWKLGLKAIAIYRDNCKVAQPLSIAKKEAPAATVEEAALQHGMVRRRLPKQRPSQTISFQVGDAEGYLTAGEYPGDGLGEIFVKLGKQGSTLSGVMDALAISVSLGLQYGVPLEAYVRKFTNMRFEPGGLTDDPEVRFASSLVDYIFRRLALEYLPIDKRQELGIFTMEERTASLDAGYSPPQQPAVPQADATGQTVLPVEPPTPISDLYGDAPMCYTCGTQMQPAGSCYVCSSCGTTSGCS